jgi:hypothetical protein
MKIRKSNGGLMNTNNSILFELKNSFQRDILNKTSLADLIVRHHNYLQDCIAVLTDSESSADNKQKYLYQFLHILHMHSKAEEETLYLSFTDSDLRLARLEATVGQDEHNIIYQLASELKDMNFQLAWSEEVEAKAKVLATIVETHLQEEETEMLPLINECMDELEQVEIANDYLNKCEEYLHYEMLTPAQYSSYPYSPLLNN